MNKALQIVNDKTGAIAVNGKFAITPVGLRILTNPSFDDYCSFWNGIQRLDCATQWTKGDVLNYAEKKWGEKYAQAIDDTGDDYGTLANYKWVSSKINFSLRNEKLSWWHHRLIAKDDYTDEQRKELLAVAERDRLSVAQFKKYLLAQKWMARIVENSSTEAEPRGLVHGDFRRAMEDLPNNSIDMIFTDPPYDEAHIPDYTDLAEIASRKLKSGGSLVAYAGHYALPQILSGMGEHLRYWWLLCVKHGGQSARLPGKWVMVDYKPLVWFVKDGRNNQTYVADFYQSTPTDKNLHDWQQDTSEASYYIEKLTNPGDLVADPFVGSGTTLVAALQLGRAIWGCDIDLNAVHISGERLNGIAGQPKS